MQCITHTDTHKKKEKTMKNDNNEKKQKIPNSIFAEGWINHLYI